MPSAQEQTVEGNSSSSSTTAAAGRNNDTSSGGGDVARGKDQPGTMFHAAKVGDADFIQSEILNGADVNEKDSNGESALMIASQHGHEEAVRWLALAGARTEDADRTLGTTALMFACIGGHHKAVRALLAARANVDVRFDSDGNGITPLMFAVQYCGVTRLGKKEPWARFGATVQELLRGGASVDLKDKKERTALTFAAELGHPEVTSWLLKAEADMEASDENGTTPLMFACRGGHAVAALALLRAGADCSASTSKGSTPLHFAASAGCSPVMKQLLDKGAPIDAKTEDGDTALSLAVSSGSVGSVGFLVKAGADLDLVDKEGRSCLDLAAVMFTLFPEEGRQVIMHFLQNNGATFKLIDDETIQASHETAASLGVKTDSEGKYSVASLGAVAEGEGENGDGEGAV